MSALPREEEEEPFLSEREGMSARQAPEPIAPADVPKTVRPNVAQFRTIAVMLGTISVLTALTLVIVMGIYAPMQTSASWRTVPIDTSTGLAIVDSPNDCPVTLQADTRFPLAQKHCPGMCVVIEQAKTFDTSVRVARETLVAHEALLRVMQAVVLARNALAVAARFAPYNATLARNDTLSATALTLEEKYAAFLAQAGTFYDLMFPGDDNAAWAAEMISQGTALNDAQKVQIAVQIALAATEYAMCVAAGGGGWWINSTLLFVGFDARIDFRGAASVAQGEGATLNARAAACANATQSQLDASWAAVSGEGPLTNTSYQLPAVFFANATFFGDPSDFIGLRLAPILATALAELNAYIVAMAGPFADPLSGDPTNVLVGSTRGLLAVQRGLMTAQCLNSYYGVYVLATLLALSLAGIVLLLLYAAVAAAYWAQGERRRRGADILFALLTIGSVAAGVAIIGGLFASMRAMSVSATSVIPTTPDFERVLFEATDVSYDGMSGEWLWGASLPALGMAVLCLALGWWLTA